MSETNTPHSGGTSGSDSAARRRRRGSRGGRGRSRRRPTNAPAESTPGAGEPAELDPVEQGEATESNVPETLAAGEAAPPMESAEGGSEHRHAEAPATGEPEAGEAPVQTAAPAPGQRRDREPRERREPREPRDSRPRQQEQRASESRHHEPRPPQPERGFRLHRPPQPPNPPPLRNIPAVGQAIDEVYRIIETLQHVMEDLDELLETLELADRQKIEDERELEKLRQALRQVQRPRDVLQRPPQHPAPAAHALRPAPQPAPPAAAPAPEAEPEREADTDEDERKTD